MANPFPSPGLGAAAGFAQGFSSVFTSRLQEKELEEADRRKEERAAFLKAYYTDPTAFNSPAGERYFRDLFPDKSHSGAIANFRGLLHGIFGGGAADSTTGTTPIGSSPTTPVNAPGSAPSETSPATPAATSAGGTAADRQAALGAFAKRRSEARERFLTEDVPTGTRKSMKIGAETVTRSGPPTPKDPALVTSIKAMRAADAAGDTQTRDALMQDINNKLTTPEQKEAIFVDRLMRVIPLQQAAATGRAMDIATAKAKLAGSPASALFDDAEPGETLARYLKRTQSSPAAQAFDRAMNTLFGPGGVFGSDEPAAAAEPKTVTRPVETPAGSQTTPGGHAILDWGK